MKRIGRIVARNNIIGLYFPFPLTKPNESLDGLYDIVEIMGELSIVRIGEAHMDKVRQDAYELRDLLDHRPDTCMTTKELEEVGDI